MHPQLDKNRFAECEQLMDALEECHKKEFLKQAMGMCNFEKDQLTRCLHRVRLDDSKDRIRISREKQKKFEQRRKEIEEEVYGKNNYLKKVIDTRSKQ